MNEMSPGELIPLFPLSLVLLPGMPLPLHIFEERYKEMISDVIRLDGEFGIVRVRDNGILNIGCTARVQRILRRYPDGRLDLLASGQRRFQIQSLDEEKSYLRGAVEFFDDEDTRETPPDLQHRAATAYHLLRTVEEGASLPQEPEFASNRVSFQLAQAMEDLDKRQTVLALRSEIQRLEYLVRVIPEYVAQRQHIEAAKRVAPLNGHVKGGLK